MAVAWEGSREDAKKEGVHAEARRRGEEEGFAKAQGSFSSRRLIFHRLGMSSDRQQVFRSRRMQPLRAPA